MHIRRKEKNFKERRSQNEAVCHFSGSWVKFISAITNLRESQWIAKARFCRDCTRAIRRMFRERRDDNEEAARKRWPRRDVWQGSLRAGRPGGSCAAKSRDRERAREDREERERWTRGGDERSAWMEVGQRKRQCRDRSAVSQSGRQVWGLLTKYKDYLPKKRNIVFLFPDF